MTIKNKLTLSSLLLLVLFISLGSAVFLGYRHISNNASIASAFDNQAKMLQMVLRGINESIITEGTPQSVGIIQRGIDGFTEYNSIILDDENQSQLHRTYKETVVGKWEIFLQGIQPFLEHHLDPEDDKLMMQYGKLTRIADQLIKDIDSLSITTRSAVDSSSKTTEFIKYIMVAVLFLSTIIIMYISFQLYRSIVSPINELTNIAEGLGKGDFSNLMKDASQDEFGILATHFNQASGNLGMFISKLKEHITYLSNNSEKSSQTAAQIAVNTKDQSTQIINASSSIEELSSSFINVAKNASDAANSAKEATDLASEGGNVVTETIEGMNKISNSVKEVATTIESLGKSSEQIGEIIKVINDIASQTNLLALNAAIEAARAGEQGRGFAVVADEVRKLAERTTSSTNEIGEMIQSIQDKANSAVESMNIGTNDVESGVVLANKAGNSLDHIVASIEKVSEMIEQIATAVEQQSVTGEEVAANIESVASIIQRTAAEADQSSSTSKQLFEMSTSLQNMAEEFKVTESTVTMQKHEIIGDQGTEIPS
jgi:methyl-accepting chemotaxis protein